VNICVQAETLGAALRMLADTVEETGGVIPSEALIDVKSGTACVLELYDLDELKAREERTVSRVQVWEATQAKRGHAAECQCVWCDGTVVEDVNGRVEK
jgi:hypothetical protein